MDKRKRETKYSATTVIAVYNWGMGGADLLNCALSSLRLVIRGEKWYWPLVTNAINIAFVYYWRLYCIVSGKTIPQKDFRRQIVGIMIRQSKPHVIGVDSRPIKAHKVADEMRCDGLGHYPNSCPIQKCLVCGKSCKNSCEKCKRILHVKTCFQIFHENWQYDDIITTTCIIFII